MRFRHMYPLAQYNLLHKHLQESISRQQLMPVSSKLLSLHIKTVGGS